MTTDDVISFTISNYDDNAAEGMWNRRDFKPREVNEAVGSKVEESEEEAKKAKEAEVPKSPTEDIDTIEDRFKRENRKSTKSTKSLTLPMDPLKRKDSSSSSLDLSKVKV